MLSINFMQIKNSTKPLTHIECEVDMRPEFLQRSQKLIYQAKNVQLTGDVFYNEPYVTGDFGVEADLVVPSSRSLSPVSYHEKFRFSENYTDLDVNKAMEDESALPVVKVENDLIDLQTAVEDNMLLHIPTTILTAEEKKGNYPKGQGWSVVSEAEFAEGKKNQINPAFAKLEGFFDQEDSKDKKKK